MKEVEPLWRVLLELLTQFGGGPRSPEDNLIRFGLPAIMWAVLLAIAWNRQREEARPREQLLVFGFGLALFRELFMLGHLALQLSARTEHSVFCLVVVPLEHTLTLASLVLIAAAFLRYILDKPWLHRRYLRHGLAVIALASTVTFITWPQAISVNPAVRFHETTPAWFIHLLGALLLLMAIVILVKESGAPHKIVVLALGFFFISESLVLFNFLTARAYKEIVCPLSNNFYIWGIPLFGFVYFREQSAEKRRAEEALRAYRRRLEELVRNRTAELRAANQQLHTEIEERVLVEAQVARRNTELTAQIAIADTLSQSLDLNVILHSVLERTLSLMRMDAGCLILLGPCSEVQLRIATERDGSGHYGPGDGLGCLCQSLAGQVAYEREPRTLTRNQDPESWPSVISSDGRFRLLVSIPLVVHGQGIGALTLASANLAELASEELELLRVIGGQIGVAVENARLYQQTERWAQGVARLNELSLKLNATLEPDTIYQLITHQSARLLGCPVALFYLWEPAEGRAREVSGYGLPMPAEDDTSSFPIDTPILSDLMSCQRPLQIPPAAEDGYLPAICRARLGKTSLVALAIRGRSVPLGFLFLAAAKSDRCWSSDEIDLLDRFADRAAIALENAFLHQQLEWAAAVEERQRIAAEMHDGLAQTLSYLSLLTDRAHQLLQIEQVEPALKEFSHMQAIIDQANHDVRRSIASLHESPPSRASVQELLEQIAAEQVRDRGPTTTVESNLARPLYLPSPDLEQISRIAKEALVNARRHGRSRIVRLTLSQETDCYRLEVADDGRGFEPASLQAQDGNHFGLAIMRARAARLKGTLTTSSRPGSGTTVTLTWPVVTGRDEEGMAARLSSTFQEGVLPPATLRE